MVFVQTSTVQLCESYKCRLSRQQGVKVITVALHWTDFILDHWYLSAITSHKHNYQEAKYGTV